MHTCDKLLSYVWDILVLQYLFIEELKRACHRLLLSASYSQSSYYSLAPYLFGCLFSVRTLGPLLRTVALSHQNVSVVLNYEGHHKNNLWKPMNICIQTNQIMPTLLQPQNNTKE